MGLDLGFDERLVVRVAGEYVQLRLLAHLADARGGRQGDVLGRRDALQLLVGRGMVGNQHGSEILDLLIIARFGRLIPGIDFEDPAFRRLFVESRIGIIRAEREGGERQRAHESDQRQYFSHRLLLHWVSGAALAALLHKHFVR
jgi:hypothetical protein